MYYNCLLSRVWRDKFEITLFFLIKPFCYMTKKSRQKFQHLENEKSFWEMKSIFTFFKWLPVAKNCLRPDSTPLISFVPNFELLLLGVNWSSIHQGFAPFFNISKSFEGLLVTLILFLRKRKRIEKYLDVTCFQYWAWGKWVSLRQVSLKGIIGSTFLNWKVWKIEERGKSTSIFQSA